jgi:hypothetical protein
MSRKAFFGAFCILLLLWTLKPVSIQPAMSKDSAFMLANSLPPIDWTHYHNYNEIVTILFALNGTYPNIVDVFSIGKSWWNRDIYCVRLTNESDKDLKPEVFFVGYHHAREQITSELTLYFVVYAATNFGLNETITELINKSEIYVVVALNVDGFDLFEANDWQRKNASPVNEDIDGLTDEDPPEDENGNGFIDQLVDYTDPENPVFIRWEGTDNDGDYSYAEDWIGGVDLNRNYNYSWEHGVSNKRSELYRGPAPFSEPETRAIRDLALQHDFMYALSFHSGTELIVYPWGDTYNPPPDEAEFMEISQDLSNLTLGTPYMQSSHLYFSYGLWDDWMYSVAKVKALTCEIFTNKTWEGVSQPGPLPNTIWDGGLKYWFNPFPQGIEGVVLRWLPVFFYITNRTINEAFHDVAIDDIGVDRTVMGEGVIIELDVTVRNKGFFQETFNLTVYANTTCIKTGNVTIGSRDSTVIIFDWDTSGFAKGNYVLSAYASPVQKEIDVDDNNFTGNWFILTIPGDVDGNFEVDIFDITAICVCYNSEIGNPLYYANCDIDGNGIIDIYDVTTACITYGQKYP